MNQGSALESMVGTFLLKVTLGNSAQFLINKRDESLQSILIAGAPFHQEGADRLGRRFRHTHTVDPAVDFRLG